MPSVFFFSSLFRNKHTRTNTPHPTTPRCSQLQRFQRIHLMNMLIVRSSANCDTSEETDIVPIKKRKCRQLDVERKGM